jgi:cysteine desulfurase / selenocysteine lyase
MSTSDPPVGLPEGDLTGAITRLAAELFAQAPGSVGPLPPAPGAATTPPLWAVAPPPTQSDLRTLPLSMANFLGGSAPLALIETPGAAASLTPYFLEIAGHPSPSSSAAPSFPASPALPAFPASPEWPTSPAFPASPAPPAATAEPLNGVPATAPEISIGRDFQPELVPDLPSAGGIFDPLSIKRDFPILEERVHGRRLVWLDNAATTQKPRAVIERLSYFYEHENSNVHRAAHELAARATDAYESARDKTARFLNAPSAKNIVFVRGTTEAINLVAQSWGRRHVGEGDEIVISWLEHHANIVPWQQLTAATGARLRVAPVDDRGQVILEEYEKLLGPRTRLVSVSQVSNALGTIVPVKEMIDIAHRYGARVLIDGAQAVSHLPVDVQALDCDFYCFSGHKIFGPTGIGALFGKTDVLETMPPWQGGGNMISDVRFEKTTYQAPPLRFEAGTGNIADAVGLGAALDYVNTIGRERIGAYEHDLLAYATGELARVPGLQMIGTAPEKAGVLSFVLDGARTEDVGKALDQEGIAVRSGHHCAQPILRRFGLESTVRASLAPYNTCEDIDALVAALLRIQSGRVPGL